MSAGVPKYNIINLGDLSLFSQGEEVSLETLEEKNLLNVSGKEAKLPLKVCSLAMGVPSYRIHCFFILVMRKFMGFIRMESCSCYPDMG